MRLALPEISGFTSTEQYRHECEVRYVVAMPTKQQRADYLASLPKWRSAAAVERLKADVRAAWAARSAAGAAPHPAGQEAARAFALGGVEVACDGAEAPGVGSFQHPSAAGDSSPDKGVDSGVAA